MRFSFTLFLFILLKDSVQGCDFSTTGIGTFDGNSFLSWGLYTSAGGGELGVFSQDNAEVHRGPSALKAEVNVSHSWGMRTFSSCDYIFKKDHIYKVKLWLNGGIGKSVKVAIQQHDGGTAAVIAEESVVIDAAGWKAYELELSSDGDYTKGKVKLTFPDVGVVSVDELTMQEFPPKTFMKVLANDARIQFSGVADQTTNADSAVLYRFPRSYATSDTKLTNPQVSWTTSNRAAASSGIALSFRTNSENIKVHFEEKRDYTGGVFTLAFAVYKNGVFQQVMKETTDVVELSLHNSGGQMVSWTITFPAFGQVNFTGLEIESGATLENYSVDNRKIYVAIGNSITHGQGQTDLSTHLTYPWQVADSLDYQLYNWGIGGSKVNELVFDNFSAAGITPDVVTVLWGYNDFNCAHANCNTDAYITDHTLIYYRSLMTRMANAFPSAIIMGVLPTFSTTPDKSFVRSLSYLRSEQEKILLDLKNTFSNICYFDGLSVTDAMSLSDAVHLNDAGATAIAHRIITELNHKVVVDVNRVDAISSKLYPHPVIESTLLRFKNDGDARMLIFRCWDSQGRFQKEIILDRNPFPIGRQALPTGFYTYLICDEHNILQRGKIRVE